MKKVNSYWTLVMLSVLFGAFHYIFWSSIIGHSREFSIYFFNFLIFNVPAALLLFSFFKLNVNNKIENLEKKSLNHMGIFSLTGGLIILFLFLIVYPLVPLSELSTYPLVFLFPLLSPLLLILIGLIFIKHNK